jgi:uncharacterized protein YaiI (UPF0178 family)
MIKLERMGLNFLRQKDMRPFSCFSVQSPILLKQGLNEMHIWVDADACPKMIKEILYRAAIRTKTQLTLVANSFLTYPNSPFIRSVRVEKGFDSADHYIVNHLKAQDLVITADIPLAAEVVVNNGLAINPRGELYTENNIKQRLNLRDMNEQLRATGERIGGPPVLSIKEKTAFANTLDRCLAKKN